MQSNMGFQTASHSSAIEINKVLKNTYMLLSMTLAFSAVTAGISMAMNLPSGAALVMTLVAFGLMFVVNK
ncbi:MAG: BAX inhibitor (BI)-1/YccA family protein, partial [Pseudoalteromonas sp.]|nr:BAX inhibitor (BI)-1/YccA family protein [Pseudoalteromonas sp.]